MSTTRQKRTAEQINQILSELLLRDARDPRLQALTITRVVIDRELKYASVYVNALGDEARQDEALAALEKASGFFRRELAQRIRLRTAPELRFLWDPTLQYAEEVHEILDQLVIPPGDDAAGPAEA
jgi:ribosome-binding factor A